MPSLVVHVAVAGLVGGALLGREFDRRSVLLVLLVPVIPDLDAFAGLFVVGAHRALLHTLLIPLGAAALVWFDTTVREASWLRGRYGARGVHLAWVGVVVYAFAGIGLDLFTDGGANPFYPLHDQFYEVSGRLQYSTTVGWEQTFVELHPGVDATKGAQAVECPDADGGGERALESGPADPHTVDLGQRGSSKEVHVNSGVDPSPGPECPGVERIFPVAQSGWELLLVVTGAVVVGGRLTGRRFGETRAGDRTGFAPAVGSDPMTDATVRVYDHDADWPGLWELKTAFERELGNADEAKAETYDAKLTDDYRAGYRGWVGDCVSRDPDCISVVEADGDLVGYVFVLPASFAFVWDAAVLNELYLAPDHRGSGLADALLDRAVAHARGQDLPLDRLVLDVDPANGRAARVYERYGFEPWAEMVAYDLDG
jgi:ribosomal protein S18 acetylase RimI-like enzyme